MRITVRTWAFTPAGQQCIFESVEVDQIIFDQVRVWAYRHKDLLTRRKYSTTEAERGYCSDQANQRFNQFIRTLPTLYQRNTSEFKAVSHLYTLYSDNPELLPDAIESSNEGAISNVVGANTIN